jgi:hypothetical protein
MKSSVNDWEGSKQDNFFLNKNQIPNINPGKEGPNKSPCLPVGRNDKNLKFKTKSFLSFVIGDWSLFGLLARPTYARRSAGFA